jgi:adenylate kinase
VPEKISMLPAVNWLWGNGNHARVICHRIDLIHFMHITLHLNEHMTRLLLFGPPGAGKGTQAKLLSDRFEIPHFSTGDMLRAAIAADTDVGRLAKSYMDGGNLVPDPVMVDIVRATLASPIAANGFLLDGYPRTVPQAEALSTIFRDLSIEAYAVVNICLSDEDIVQRLSSRLVCPHDGRIFTRASAVLQHEASCPECGSTLVQREDDRPETVRERLRVYHMKTAPVLTYYANRTTVITVDGSAPVDEVHENILTALARAGVT